MARNLEHCGPAGASIAHIIAFANNYLIYSSPLINNTKANIKTID